MFGPSEKSVPGCLVSIVPMLIGVPLAATPGFGPQLDVSLEPPLELAAVELVLELDALVPELAGAAADDVELLLLPHPASSAAPMSAASATTVRRRSACLYITLTFVLLLVLIRSTRPGVARRGSYSAREMYAIHA
jgi:hypothetical protein